MSSIVQVSFSVMREIVMDTTHNQNLATIVDMNTLR